MPGASTSTQPNTSDGDNWQLIGDIKQTGGDSKRSGSGSGSGSGRRAEVKEMVSEVDDMEDIDQGSDTMPGESSSLSSSSSSSAPSTSNSKWEEGGEGKEEQVGGADVGGDKVAIEEEERKGDENDSGKVKVD